VLKIITRKISNFKLWTAIRLHKAILYAKYLKPRKIKLICMPYFLLSLLLSFLPSRLSFTVTKHIESIMNRIKGFMFYYTLGKTQIIFILPDYESVEIINPMFEYTNMKVLYHIIKTKFKGTGILIDVGAHIGK